MIITKDRVIPVFGITFSYHKYDISSKINSYVFIEEILSSISFRITRK